VAKLANSAGGEKLEMTSKNPEQDHGGRLTDKRFWPALVTFVIVPVVIAILMAYYLLICRRVVGEIGFPLDDSWIHVRFAQNLARGYGFSFNPGEPASTTTAPLWTLILALGYRLTHEYVFTAAALNWVLCSLTAITAGALARTLVPHRSFGAAVALLVAVTIPLSWFALSGMEPPLFKWLTLLGILMHVRYRRAPGVKGIVPTVVFGIAVYARPELVLLFGLAMVDRLLMLSRERRETGCLASWIKQVLVHTPVFALLVAPLVIHNMRVIDRPLPSSYYIKAYNFGITWGIATGMKELVIRSLVVAPIKEVFANLWMWFGNNVALLVPFLFGFGAIVRRAARLEIPKHSSFLIPLLLVVQPVARGISTNFYRAPWFQSQRYAANLGPLYLLVGMVGLWWWLQERRPRKLKLVLATGLCLMLVASLARQPDQARLFAHNVKNITEMQVTTARWLKANVPDHSVLAVNDVGAIAAITDFSIVDMIGLVSPETLACRTLENAIGGKWVQCTWEVAESKNPDYLVLVMQPERYEGYLRGGHRPIFDIKIDDNITCGGPWIVVFEWRGLRRSSEGAADSREG